MHGGRVRAEEYDGLGEEALPEPVSFIHQTMKRLPDCSKLNRQLPGWVEYQMIFFALVLMLCREAKPDPEMLSAKRSTFCSDLRSWIEQFLYHIEMH